MKTPTEQEQQARLAELKKIPQQVQMAGLFAFLLGIVTFLRVVARAYAMHLPMGKGVFYGFLLMFWFFVAGASLYYRSRWGYIGLLALMLIPLLGLFSFSVHLLRIALDGTLTANWPDTIHCATALAQFAATCAVLRYVLSKQVRAYVWTAPPNSPAAADAGSPGAAPPSLT